MKQVRCAIYTRKSSDEGLEQDFNSLDAQREACAAYIASQASEGWELVPDHYDDGGISGGTLERPALQELLSAIVDGKIDIVVIYKIDRLTRSLLDFAKLVETFDKAGTSFVAVTQSFNTTNSMGRLTLNMLLSFAQFEREVTAERIRDKLAASKAKGMWMGGIPPLGYKAAGRTLAIVEPHAELVRHLFARYQSLGKVRLLAAELEREGQHVPTRRLGSGRKLGGGRFSRGQIYNILKNPVYMGKISHKGLLSQGNHPAIIDPAQWSQVQSQLATHVKGIRTRREAIRSPLSGLIHDGSGEPMLASHTVKGKQRYRYYVSKPVHLGLADVSADHLRVPAGEIEDAVAFELAQFFDDPLALAERAGLQIEPTNLLPLAKASEELAAQLRTEGPIGVSGILARIEIHATSLHLTIATEPLAARLGAQIQPHSPSNLTLSRELRLTRTGRAIRLIQDNGSLLRKSDADPALVNHLAKAQRWWTQLRKGEITPTDLARQENVSLSYLSRVVRSAFLAPAVVDAILAGRQRPIVTARMLLRRGAIPAKWCDQEKMFIAS